MRGGEKGLFWVFSSLVVLGGLVVENIDFRGNFQGLN